MDGIHPWVKPRQVGPNISAKSPILEINTLFDEGHDVYFVV